MLRGSTIGTFIGAIPAAGSAIAVAVAYTVEQRLSKNPEEFGKGAPAGIVAPEAANNACVAGALVPMMTLGVPGDTMTAVLMGALLLHGLRPGPLLFTDNPEFVGTIYGSLFMAILFTLLFGFLAIVVILQLMKISRHVLMIAIAIFCIFGAFTVRNTPSDIYVMLFFGIVGVILHKLKMSPAPLAFGLILGPLLEENVRRTLIISQGSWSVFWERPISAVLLIMSAIAILYPVIRLWRQRQVGAS